jgi:hypothetical protein
VSETVKDSIGNDGIRKEFLPIGHGPIGCEDDGFHSEASIDEGVEAFGGLLVNGLEGKVIDDEEIALEDAA